MSLFSYCIWWREDGELLSEFGELTAIDFRGAWAVLLDGFPDCEVVRADIARS